MRLLKVSAAVLFFVMLFSCTTTTEKASVKEDEQPTEETIKEKVLVEKEIEVNLYYPKKEVSYYGNGQIDTIKEYFYDQEYNLVKVVTSNEQGESLDTIIYQYINGFLVREDSYDFNNQLNRYITYSYDDNDKLVEETLYDKEEKIQSINTYEYDDEVLITWKTLGPNKGPMAITSYKYDGNNKLVAIEIKDAAGAIDGIIKKEYQGNNIVKEEVLNNKDIVEKSTDFLYNDNSLIETISYDSKGKKTRSESYIYEGENDKPINIKNHFKSGAVESYVDIEYNSRIVTKTVMVEEFKWKKINLL